MKYVVEVTTKVTLEIDDPGSEEKAIEQACGMAWQYDADEINGKIVQRIMSASEAIAAVVKANSEDANLKLMKKRLQLERSFKRGSGFRDEVD